MEGQHLSRVNKMVPRNTQNSNEEENAAPLPGGRAVGLGYLSLSVQPLVVRMIAAPSGSNSSSFCRSRFLGLVSKCCFHFQNQSPPQTTKPKLQQSKLRKFWRT